jgi:hypothetical protein
MHIIKCILYGKVAFHHTEDTMQRGRPAKAVHNSRRTISLSPRHDKMLTALASKLDATKTGTIERALEALEEKEARRDKELK